MKWYGSILALALSGCLITATPIARTGPISSPDIFDDDDLGRKPSAPAVRPRPAYWGMVAPGVRFSAVHFTDFNTGWLVGDVDPFTRRAVIRHTRNAGSTWATQDRGINDLRAVWFVNPNIGYVGGNNGVLFRTDDAGATWKLLDPGTGDTIVAIAFLDLTDGLLLTRDDGLFQTTDGGATWARRAAVTNGAQLEYLPSGAAWVSSGNGLYRYESGVLTRHAFPGDRPAQFMFSDPAQRSGWAVGTYGALYRTDDGGITWESVRRLTTPDEYVSRFSASAVSFADRYEGMLLTDRAAFSTLDGGTTWDRTDSRLSFTKCSRYFKLFDDSHGWAFGDGENLYRLGY